MNFIRQFAEPLKKSRKKLHFSGSHSSLSDQTPVVSCSSWALLVGGFLLRLSRRTLLFLAISFVKFLFSISSVFNSLRNHLMIICTLIFPISDYSILRYLCPSALFTGLALSLSSVPPLFSQTLMQWCVANPES